MRVSTGKLRDGDKVTVHGATILINGEPDVTIGPAGTVWSWRNMSIVAGCLDFAPQAGTWTVQGNSMCFWPVSRG